MSRNVLYVIIAVLLIFLVLVLIGRRGTASQGGFVSPTPAQGSISPEVSPSETMSPAASASPSPSSTVAPTTVQVTTSPSTTP